MSVVLSEHLPLVAAAPDGIQKLRGLILELAVRGKLVPQDPNDGPASELLKRVVVEESKGRNLKNSKALPPVLADQQPFKIPNTWAWARLGNTVEVLDSLRKPVTKDDRRPGPFPYYGASGIVDYVSDFLFDEDLVLVGEDGAKWGTGDRTAFSISGKTWVNNHAHVLRPNRALLSDSYLVHVLVARDLQPFITGTTVPKLNQAKLVSIELPLPPLAEQHRIVAKVDELMALCDRLEAEQADAASAHARLVETLLGMLTQSSDAADLAANWQRLAEHFETLFTTEASIDALKQTVLQLAVIGKLVPQAPDDEPASKLLSRMQKVRRIKRKCSAVDADSLESPLPEIPSGWLWTVVDQIAADHENSISDGPFGANLKTEHYISEAGYRFVRLQNIGYGDFRGEHHAYVTQERFLSLQKHHVYAGDLVVAGLVDDRVRCCELPKTIGHALVKADCYRFSVHPEVCSAYALHYLNSPLSSDFAAAHHHGMTLTRIGLGNFRQIPFPLPPHAEQRRIVAKIDELMTLCDSLKGDLATASQHQATLADTLIESGLEMA